MYKCNSCRSKFTRATERTVDAGGIRDAGVIGRTKPVFIGFCPNCNSRDFAREGEEIETAEKVDQSTKGVLISSWIGG